MAKDLAVLNHQEWLGYVQPVGLVVSIPALLDANARINRNFGPDHQRFLSALPVDRDGEPIPEVPDFVAFAQTVFEWRIEDLYGAGGASALPTSLEVPLPEYNETLRPTLALREFQPKDLACEWILLISVLPSGVDFDEVVVSDARGWQASPQTRFERLLRETRVPAGLLVNGKQLRVVYAPRGESSGYITFNLSDMVQVAGRPIVAALLMLLSYERLYSMAEKERLPAILENSRKFQNVVSTKLAGQVLHALYELLRGFQAANDQTHSELLRDVLANDPNHVYAGLVTTLLRLVFILYAEDRNLLPSDTVFGNNYSLGGLYERLRADDSRYHDTMDQRYGAWAQLLVLFRLIYGGGSHDAMRIPPREGYLFDPDRYLFLEGRRQATDTPTIPRVSDGVVFRILSKLLVLDGERLSYRTLAVEQIGSVYEAIMGFELHVAEGPSIGVKPAKSNGAPAAVNLEQLLKTPAGDRLKWLVDNADQKLTGKAVDELKAAKSLEELLAALDRKIDKEVTPNVVPKGAMIFQPSNERRRSGSHYTPSALTAPIVEAALAPVLRQLGENPKPEEILQLKVCDPAMGSGAFLVEACRQLGDALVKAWHMHNAVPPIPADEDEVLHARRRIAQRCLYGVDKNPLAADLAKLSLWLATLAKDHPFTFLDHSFRAGDSLVGLTRRQIAAFHWLPAQQQSFLEEQIRKRIDHVSGIRQRILAAADDTPYPVLRQKLDQADQALFWMRLAGDAAIAAFFSADKPKTREQARAKLRDQLEVAFKNQGKLELTEAVEAAVASLRKGAKGVIPFHWELEFPEVFTTDAKGKVIDGFDVIVGNPPYAGKNTLINAHADAYLDWLMEIHEESHGNSDLIAHFFRRAFNLLRTGACFGLIATKTIRQGDTRSTGLRWICTHAGTIYKARRRLKWPGQAAVTVSVIHVAKALEGGPYLLDERSVPIITAYLFHAGGHEDPAILRENADKSFVGSFPLGMGFTFDDTDTKGVTNSLADMNRLIAKDPHNAERIRPYIGGEEVNDSPSYAHHRFIIDFFDFSLEQAGQWPELLEIVRRKVKPIRDHQKREANRERWWQYAEKRPGLYNAIRGLDRVLVTSQVSKYRAFSFLRPDYVFDQKLIVFPVPQYEYFTMLQSNAHLFWSYFFGVTLEDRPVYTPSDCFETFPFPRVCDNLSSLEQAGQQYYELRAALMVKNNEGLTATYNRFHDPEDDSPDVLRLRQLHANMDRAVLDAYGWTDIQPTCHFLLDYEEEADEEENGSRRRKKPWRYRWPDQIRDEVLARLLELNHQRALEEGQVLTAAPVGAESSEASPNHKNSSAKRKVTVSKTSMFPEPKGVS
jgi:N-6 DNA Methylase